MPSEMWAEEVRKGCDVKGDEVKGTKHKTWHMIPCIFILKWCQLKSCTTKGFCYSPTLDVKCNKCSKSNKCNICNNLTKITIFLSLRSVLIKATFGLQGGVVQRVMPTDFLLKLCPMTVFYILKVKGYTCIHNKMQDTNSLVVEQEITKNITDTETQD